MDYKEVQKYIAIAKKKAIKSILCQFLRNKNSI